MQDTSRRMLSQSWVQGESNVCWRQTIAEFGASPTQVDQDASPGELKQAYRAMQKVCHPDILGEDRGHRLCIVLNEVCGPTERACTPRLCECYIVSRHRNLGCTGDS